MKGDKILLIPLDHPAHVNFFLISGQALVNKGHDVYVLTLEKYHGMVNKTVIKPILWMPVKSVSRSDDPLIKNISTETAFGSVGITGKIAYFKQLTGIFETQAIDILENEKLQTEIQQKKFDLALIDGTFPMRPYYAIAYKQNLRYITLTVAEIPWESKVPAMPSVEPSPLGTFSNQMKFFQRLQNLIINIGLNYIALCVFGMPEDFVLKHVPEEPFVTLSELYLKSEMFLITMDVYVMNFPRVSAPHSVYVGAIGGQPPKALERDLELFANKAKKGVILFSFGSLAKEFPQHILKNILAAFSKLSEYHIVMQFSGDLDKTLKISSNVKLMKWLPQNDLLGHKQAKLFFNHAGTNGVKESLYHGVPMVIAPLVSDQFTTASIVVHKQYGKQIDINKVDADEIFTTLQEVLNNPTYSHNTKKAQRIIRGLPKGEDTVAFWVDHVVRFGSDHIRPAYIEMPLYQLFMLDILAFLAVLTLISCCLFYKCCSFSKKWLMSSKKAKKE